MRPAPDGMQLCPSRRALLQRLGALGVGTIVAGVVTGCSGDEATPAATPQPTEAPEPTASVTAEATAEATEDGTESDADQAVSGIPVSEVPVGQARIVDLAGQRAVLAQPSRGTFVAFSARCTHQGTVIAASSDLQLACPAHGSRYDASDGSVVRGPASSPLETIKVRVRGDQVVPVAG